MEVDLGHFNSLVSQIIETLELESGIIWAFDVQIQHPKLIHT